MISQPDVDAVISTVEAKGLSESLISELRNQYDYHFTYCMEDDMDASTPAIERKSFNVYFVNSSDHCSKLTTDPASASGFVLAEIIDDE